MGQSISSSVANVKNVCNRQEEETEFAIAKGRVSYGFLHLLIQLRLQFKLSSPDIDHSSLISLLN